MNLYDLIKLILSKHYLFEVIVPGKASYPKQNADQVDQLYGSIENYFTKIANSNSVAQVTVNLYAKNGSSYLRKETITAHVTPTVEKSTPANLNGAENIHQTQNYQPTHTMITKADIEVVQLRTENKFLNEKVDELKNRNKELEKKNDEYYSENLRLTREHATEKDKRDLEYRQKELELNSKQKQGLSGILDDVKTMPAEAWQFIAGFMPNHPMAKGLAPGTYEQPQLNGETKHTDGDAQACIEVINTLLLKQTPEIVGMAAMLTEHLVNNPNILKAVYEKFFPGQTNEQTTSNS